ncbi:MAG: tetratricopeptide repeat protein, partial [Chitinophagales bacterium]|nr:tetratricopeptide repeat protein [Chitinophagales bacterium]
MDEASAVELKELENLFAKANGLLEKKDYSSSKLIANKLLVHAKQCHSSLFQARAYGLFAFISYNFNEIKKAINFFELSHETYLGLKRVDPLEIFKTRNSLGVVYKLNGELWKSMLVLKSSIELAEQHDIPNSSGYNNIAVIYSSQKKFEKALAFFKMAKKVELRNKKPDDIKINQFDSNSAKMLISLNRLSEAETILDKTKSFFEDKNDISSVALNYRCLAQLNFNKGDYAESEKWLLKVLSFS